MKKWLLFILVLVIAGVGAFYFFAASPMAVFQTSKIETNRKAFSRTILEENVWKKWWPGTTGNGMPTVFQYNGNTYTIAEKKFSSLTINIQHAGDLFKTELFFVPIETDSIMLTWQDMNALSPSIFRKMQLYNPTRKINKDLAAIMEKIKLFYANDENIYSLKINKAIVTDSTLIATFMNTDTYPSVESIYALIDKLRSHATQHGASQTDSAMLNIYTTDGIHYRTQVALPVDKKLEDENDIHYRWMLGGGNILESDVTGGYNTINKGFKAMETYIEDYGRVAPAIPFQLLITDRRQQPDTGKWVTRLCWPVM